MARYYRRRWYRHHPYAYWPYYERTVTGIVVGAILGFFVALFGGIAGALWRYRSELTPLAVAGTTVWCAEWLHVYYSGLWWTLALVTAVLVAVLMAFPRWWRRVRWPVLGRGIERVYLAMCLAVGGAWLSSAIHYGPGRHPLPALALAGTLVCAIPWWAHRRRRAKVRVERTLQAWPDVADAAGLTGSRAVSAVVDAWGWTVRIALPRGQTADEVIAAVPAIESGLGAPPSAARAEPDPHRADRAYLRVLERDPHAQPIAYQPPVEPATITRPIPLGLWDDGTVTSVLMLRRNTLIGGITDSGKSNLLNVIMAYLVACPDVVIWGIDLKGGMELGPWASCLPRLATTPQQAIKLLADAVAEISLREQEQVARGERLWTPDYDRPALIVVIDEYAELPDEATAHADSIARLGRAVAVNLLIATQRPTQKAMRNNAVRSQMDVRICLRVRERRDVTFILGEGMLAAGWNAHKLGEPGKFLLSARESQYATPRPARAYLLTDTDVATIATRHGRFDADDIPDSDSPPEQPRSPERLLLEALSAAPDEGITVPELMAVVGKPRRWVYRRLEQLANTSRVVQVTWGHWRTPVTPPDDDTAHGT
ncbi:cell division protein FtsK [Actinomycetes bacterium KLBMP 9797]